MQFRVDVDQSADGWEVQVRDEHGQPVPGSPRRLGSMGGGMALFPHLLAAEVTALSARPACGRPEHCGLCTGDTAQFLQDTLAALLAGDTQESRVVRFGRYLFNILLGDEVWATIRASLAQHDVELALTWRDSEAVISRLPWEMMHSGTGFLAMEPRLAITRRIAGAAAATSTLTSPPRVLFVVGTTANDQEVRPGAEYLGLLRGLRWSRAGLTLKPHLLLEAAQKTLKAAIEWFRPTVIHFACHGGFDLDGKPYLEFRHDDGKGGEVKVHASQIAALLQAATPRPEIVVVTACHSASARAGQIASPFAVELVKCGTPVVVGMAGQVADQACRLFTRRFYEALLLGEEITQAAAQGRRAGIVGTSLTDPATSVDWAMPTLFLTEGVGEPGLARGPLEALRRWEEAAADYPCDGYPAFCGRLETLQWYDQLMADAGAQQSIWRHEGGLLQMLAVTPHPSTSLHIPPVQVGRTRLLQEWAVRAARDGHVPVLVAAEVMPGNEWPMTFPQLREALMLAVRNARARLGLGQWQWSAVRQLEDVAAGASLPSDLPPEVREEYRGTTDPQDPRVWAVAFRLDLLELLATARQRRPEAPERTRLLLLIDDVHRMGEAAEALLDHILGPVGLRDQTAREQVRVVFTYAPDAPGTTGPVGRWLEAREQWVGRVILGQFQQPVEDELAYRHFLLHYRDPVTNSERPLAVVPAKGRANLFLKAMRQRVQGVPGNLRSGGTDVVGYLLLDEEYPTLRDANDEDVLRLTYSGAEAPQ